MSYSKIYQIIILTIQSASVVCFAAPPIQKQNIDLETFLNLAVDLDYDLQKAKLQAQSAYWTIKANDLLYPGQIEIAPYYAVYDLNNPSSSNNYDYRESGLKYTISQSLSTGTQLQFTSTQANENTRLLTQANNKTYSVSLIQPLWNNGLGLSQRKDLEAAELNYHANTLNVDIATKNSCKQMTDLFVGAWVKNKKLEFANQVIQDSSELYSRGQLSFKKGQIGKLDWLGLQSDYLQYKKAFQISEDESIQYENQIRTKLPEISSKQFFLSDIVLLKILDQLKNQNVDEVLLQKSSQQEYWQLLEQSYLLKSESAKSSSLPELNLKISQQWSEGKIESSNYDDQEQNASLQLIWRWNDNLKTSNYEIARLESLRYSTLKNQYLQERRQNIKNLFQLITSSARQIEIEKQRVILLQQISEENEQRFLQGRIEYQTYLQTKQQWVQTQNQVLDQTQDLWTKITALTLLTDINIPGCKKTK